MSLEQLGQELQVMYDRGPKALQVHLFGIKYGNRIREWGYTSQEILSHTELSPSYHVEVNKGINLSEHVVLKNNPLDLPTENRPTAESVMGILSAYANPELIPLEKEAWADAAVEKHKRILQDYS